MLTRSLLLLILLNLASCGNTASSLPKLLNGGNQEGRLPSAEQREGEEGEEGKVGTEGKEQKLNNDQERANESDFEQFHEVMSLGRKYCLLARISLGKKDLDGKQKNILNKEKKVMRDICDLQGEMRPLIGDQAVDSIYLNFVRTADSFNFLKKLFNDGSNQELSLISVIKDDIAFYGQQISPMNPESDFNIFYIEKLSRSHNEIAEKLTQLRIEMTTYNQTIRFSKEQGKVETDFEGYEFLVKFGEQYCQFANYILNNVNLEKEVVDGDNEEELQGPNKTLAVYKREVPVVMDICNEQSQLLHSIGEHIVDSVYFDYVRIADSFNMLKKIKIENTDSIHNLLLSSISDNVKYLGRILSPLDPSSDFSLYYRDELKKTNTEISQRFTEIRQDATGLNGLFRSAIELL